MAALTDSKDEIVRRIVQFASEQPTILAAYIFGSVVPQRLTVESDVDIGLLFESPAEGLRLMELQEELTGVLGRQVDLVGLNQVSPILAMQVLKHGEVVFARSERAVREFQIRTLFAYFDLKQVRKPIEEALLLD
jgi:predicted nucleotidyltransferase